jgi:hypothetical protein
MCIDYFIFEKNGRDDLYQILEKAAKKDIDLAIGLYKIGLASDKKGWVVSSKNILISHLNEDIDKSYKALECLLAYDLDVKTSLDIANYIFSHHRIISKWKTESRKEQEKEQEEKKIEDQERKNTYEKAVNTILQLCNILRCQYHQLDLNDKDNKNKILTFYNFLLKDMLQLNTTFFATNQLKKLVEQKDEQAFDVLVEYSKYNVDTAVYLAELIFKRDSSSSNQDLLDMKIILKKYHTDSFTAQYCLYQVTQGIARYDWLAKACLSGHVDAVMQMDNVLNKVIGIIDMRSIYSLCIKTLNQLIETDMPAKYLAAQALLIHYIKSISIYGSVQIARDYFTICFKHNEQATLSRLEQESCIEKLSYVCDIKLFAKLPPEIQQSISKPTIVSIPSVKGRIAHFENKIQNEKSEKNESLGVSNKNVNMQESQRKKLG